MFTDNKSLINENKTYMMSYTAERLPGNRVMMSFCIYGFEYDFNSKTINHIRFAGEIYKIGIIHNCGDHVKITTFGEPAQKTIERYVRRSGNIYEIELKIKTIDDIPVPVYYLYIKNA